jgi:hypothetical protein
VDDLQEELLETQQCIAVLEERARPHEMLTNA